MINNSYYIYWTYYTQLAIMEFIGSGVVHRGRELLPASVPFYFRVNNLRVQPMTRRMQSAPQEKPDATPTHSPFDRTIMAVVMAGTCTFLNVYSTQPLLPLLRRLFHASELEVSFTVSATTLAVAMVAPFIGLLAERLGRKKVIVPALFWLTVPTLLAGTASGLHTLIFWRFAQGLFIPGIIAVIIAYINEEWEGRNVGVAMSAYVAGTVLGGFLGRYISGLIANFYSWRLSFLALGLLNLAGACMVRAWLPPARNFKPSAHISHALAEVKQHVRNPRLLATFGLGFTVLFSLVGCFTYANFYLAAPPFGLNSAQLGSVFFVYLFGVIVTPLAGKFIDRYGFRKSAILFSVMSVAGLLLTFVRTLPVVIAGLAIFSSGIFIAQSSATVLTGVISGRGRSSAAGLYVMFYYLGGSVGTILTGWFWLWHGWATCVMLLVAAALISLKLGFIAGSEPSSVSVEGPVTIGAAEAE